MRENHRKRTLRMGDHGRPSRNSVYQGKSGLKLHFKKSKHYVLTFSILIREQRWDKTLSS